MLVKQTSFVQLHLADIDKLIENFSLKTNRHSLCVGFRSCEVHTEGALLPELRRWPSGTNTHTPAVGREATCAFKAARSSSVHDTCQTWNSFSTIIKMWHIVEGMTYLYIRRATVSSPPPVNGKNTYIVELEIRKLDKKSRQVMHKPSGFLGDLDKNEDKYPCRTMRSLNVLVSTTREVQKGFRFSKDCPAKISFLLSLPPAPPPCSMPKTLLAAPLHDSSRPYLANCTCLMPCLMRLEHINPPPNPSSLSWLLSRCTAQGMASEGTVWGLRSTTLLSLGRIPMLLSVLLLSAIETYSNAQPEIFQEDLQFQVQMSLSPAETFLSVAVVKVGNSASRRAHPDYDCYLSCLWHKSRNIFFSSLLCLTMHN
ncbi:hypothetical protein GH733_000916 [Mirounga leonina]|nr:hypothetical protein GH733_000916 [Mirounga leonina]